MQQFNMIQENTTNVSINSQNNNNIVITENKIDIKKEIPKSKELNKKEEAKKEEMKKDENKKEEIKKEEQCKEKEKELNIKKINKKEYLEQTLNMIIQSKLERYKKIFNSLDSDNDGFISSKNIRLSALDNDKLKNFTPIFEELQQSNIQMNFQDFSKKLDKLAEKNCKEINYFNLDSDDE